MAQNKSIEQLLSKKCIKGRITNSYNPKTAYRAIRKEKYKDIGTRVTEKQYLDIIKVVDQLLEKELIHGNVVKLPLGMGTVELRKVKMQTYTRNGKIKTNRTVDWSETRKLWNEDKECLESRIIVRSMAKFKIHVVYSKRNSHFINMKACKFRINRKIIQKAYKNLEDCNCLIFDKY